VEDVHLYALAGDTRVLIINTKRSLIKSGEIALSLNVFWS